MIKEPTLEYKSSRWTNSEEQTISECLVYDVVHIEVFVENTMRKQSVTSLIKVGTYRNVHHGLDERVKEESRVLTLPPLSTGKVFLSFIPTHETEYYYRVLIEGKEVYTQPKNSPPRLRAVKNETILILDEPRNNILDGSTVIFKGKLVTADSGAGVNGAKICIHDSELGRNRMIALGTTENDGAFCIDWTAKKTDRFYIAIKPHAKFEGDDFYKPSTSSRYTINIAHMPQGLASRFTGLTSRSNLGALAQGEPAHIKEKSETHDPNLLS